MKSAGVIGHSASCSTTASLGGLHGSTRATSSVDGVTPASPSAQAAQATSASPWIRAKGSGPRSSLEDQAQGGAARLVVRVVVMVRPP